MKSREEIWALWHLWKSDDFVFLCNMNNCSWQFRKISALFFGRDTQIQSISSQTFKTVRKNLWRCARGNFSVLHKKETFVSRMWTSCTEKRGELGSLQDSFRRLRRHLLSEGGKCQGGTGESRRILRLSLGESCTFLRLPPWGKAWRRKGAKKRREPKLSSLFALGFDYLVITLKTIVVATPLASVLAPK